MLTRLVSPPPPPPLISCKSLCRKSGWRKSRLSYHSVKLEGFTGVSQWVDSDCVATLGRVKQTARAVEILGSWKVCLEYLLNTLFKLEITELRKLEMVAHLPLLNFVVGSGVS